MSLPDRIDVALKEWDLVCRLLHSGQQALLLRKGGIHETEGRFELEHRAFAMFPAFEHQKLELLKPRWREEVELRDDEPSVVRVTTVCRVAGIFEVQTRDQIKGLDNRHCWNETYVDMRFSYKPQNPLYLLLLRAYRLRDVTELAFTAEYAGCRSWVPLETEIDAAGAEPSIADDAFEHLLSDVRASCGES